jgi:hypothetical protein
LLLSLLAACGGGGGSSAPPVSTAGTTQTGSTDSSGTTGNSSSGTTGGTNSPATSGSPSTPTTEQPSSSGTTAFSAQLLAAPADGTTISGVVQFQLQGTGIENAELLPPTGYAPVLGHFTVSPDKTMATLTFDTASLPNGTLRVRVSAYDKPAGTAGASEAVVMPTRQWRLQNAMPAVPTAVPDASYMPLVMLPFTNLPYVDPQALNDLWAMSDAAFSDYVTNHWTQFEATLHRYVPANVDFDFPTPNGFYAAWSSCIDMHGATACHETVLYLRGLMLSKQSAQTPA